MPYRSLLRTFALLLALALAPAVQAQSQTARYDTLLDQPGLSDGFWGVLVVDAQTGRTLYARNATRRFMPASNAKIYTGAAILDALGPNARFETRLYANGPIDEGGTLRGDLVLRGGGDPSLGSQPDENVPVDKFAILRTWADSLRASGIRRITGNVVGDNDFFDDQALGEGWTWDDEVYYYSAQLSGLAFGDNCIDLTLTPTALGQPALLSVPEAASGFADFVNRTETTARGSGLREGYARLPGTNRFVLTSRVPLGGRDHECVSVHNPTLYAAHALRWALQNAGITVDGRAADHDDTPDVPLDYDAMTLLHEHVSAPLATLVRAMEKESLNHYAEYFLKHLGRLDGRPAPTETAPLGSAARGLGVMEEGLLRRALPDAGHLSLVDGSGLSRMNAVTPTQTVALLRYMYQHPDEGVRGAFYEALPVGGVDGTLKNRFGAMRRRVQAKTGTLTGASSLSGYLTTASGRTLIFSFMANQYSAPASTARRAMDSVLARLAAL